MGPGDTRQPVNAEVSSIKADLGKGLSQSSESWKGEYL